MKKIFFIGLMFFFIISQIFSDEDISKFENINFIFLNPLFFNYNILLNYPLRNNDINKYIFSNIDIYLKEDSLFNRIYIYNEKLADYLYFQYQLLNLFDTFSGGPEKRRKKELEDIRKYNILHPNEPQKKIKETF